MKKFWFAVIPDIHLGREKVNIHFWDRASEKEAVVGIGIEERLRKAIELINKDQEIKFTIAIGDLTDSGLPEQFKTARDILDKLGKPYIPLIGNHDIWPYQWDWEKGKVAWNAKKPLDVLEFERYFEESLRVSWLLKQTGLLGLKNSLQNYSFTFQNTRFLVIDNVNRRGAPFGLPGTVAWAKLHKASKKWLERELSLTTRNRVIIFSHSPLKMGMLKRLLRKYQRKREMPLQRGAVKEIINIAGHTHKITKKGSKAEKVRVITTNALYLEPKILKVLVSEKIQFQYQNL